MTSTQRHALQRFGLLIFMSLVCYGSLGTAKTNEPILEAELPSASTKLGKTLSEQATISWREVPLHEALTRLGTTFDLPWFLDRRADPQALVNLSANQLTLAAMLDSFAQQNRLSVTLLDNVIYVGPPKGAAELLESWQRQGGANSSIKRTKPTLRLRKALAKQGITEWPHLTEPRRLIEQMLNESRIGVEGTDLIPHDLWTSGKLPKLSLSDRLTLLLVGFELNWQCDAKGRSIEIVPARQKSDQVNKLPRLADLIDTKRSSSAIARQSNEQRYSLRIESQPLRAVLTQIAKSAKRTLVIESNTEGLVDQRVSVSVEKVTLEELVNELVTAASLTAKFESDQIVISTL